MHPGIDHVTLSLATTETTETQRSFKSGATILHVRSLTRFKQHPKIRGISYTIFIQRNAGADKDEKYSLANLGIQGYNRRVFIPHIRGTNVSFVRVRTGAKKDLKIRGPFGGSKQPEKKQWRYRRLIPKDEIDVDQDRVWFLSFEGDSCELELVAFFTKKNLKPKTEHEWAPPPPDPGGEYGEDEEKDDPPEDDGEK